MCVGCVHESLLEITDDDGRTFKVWPVITAHMREVARLVAEFYELPGMSVGGPLHVELDDFNLEDHWFLPSGNPEDTSRYTVEVFTGCMPSDVSLDAYPPDGPYTRAFTDEEREVALRYCLAIVWGLGTISAPERYVAVGIGHGMVHEYEDDQRQLIAIHGRPLGIAVAINAEDPERLTEAMARIAHIASTRSGGIDTFTFDGSGFAFSYESVAEGDGGSSRWMSDRGELDLGIRRTVDPLNDFRVFAEEFTQTGVSGSVPFGIMHEP